MTTFLSALTIIGCLALILGVARWCADWWLENCRHKMRRRMPGEP